MIYSISAVLSLLLVSANAATKLAVIELGTKGAVRSTNSNNRRLASVNGVTSFFNQKATEAGMPVVPDLFKKADGSLVIGIKQDSAQKLDKMFDFIQEKIVGQVDIDGTINQIMSKLPLADRINEASSIVQVSQQHVKASPLSGVSIKVDENNLAQVDAAILELLEALKSQYEETGETLVVHIVVEDETSVAHRRLDEQANNNNNYQNEDDNYVAGQQEYNGYYGYGYYNAYGEWVTPYRTMFQIQYFNLVLWTSVGLFIALFFCIYLMIYMPLMPDTLLFGESAKMIGES